MYTQAEKKYFLSLVRCALRGESADAPDAELNLTNVFKLARLHGLIELVSYAIPSISPPPDEALIASVERLRHSGIAKEINQEVELEAIKREFGASGVDFMPLKGVVIKSLYPSPDMRSMCDIDILVRKEQFALASQIMLERLGYSQEEAIEGEHDVGFKKPPFISIELHHSMTDKDANKEAYKYYESVWSLAMPCEGETHLYELSREDFYIHHIEHLAKHYRYGGCGVRAFCDIFVYLSKYDSTLDWEYIERTLSEMKLFTFSEHVKSTALMWFGDGKGDEVSALIEEYVLDGGNFGTHESHERSTLARKYSGKDKKKMSKSKYVLGRAFLPYGEMKKAYPVLVKAPILLPFCWIGRIFSRLFKKRDSVKRQIDLKAVQKNADSYNEHICAVGLEL